MYVSSLLDQNQRIIEADDRFQEVTGYAPEEVIGKLSQFDLIPPEDRTYYMEQVGSALAKGSIAYLKHEIVCKNGERCWVVCYGEEYYDSAAKEVRSQILVFRSSGGM